ncbi:MAG: pseudouridine synthase [Spirochaetia bacterium]|nr:pseudouridine synthase [Spirochaetia bacterium]
MMNKPLGAVCSTVSDRSTTVFQLLGPDVPARLSIVGRLDKDTSGLLLLSDDGMFVHTLTIPESQITKTYHVWLRSPVSPAQQYEYTKRCADGLDLPPCEKSPAFTAAPARLEWLDVLPPELGCASSAAECLLTISEGKFHQVKRMMEELGNQVAALERIAIGSLELDKKIAPGQYRRLSSEEFEKLAHS